MKTCEWQLPAAVVKLFWKYLEQIQEHVCIELQVSLSYKFRKTSDWFIEMICIVHITIKIKNHKTSKISSRAYISGELIPWN